MKNNNPPKSPLSGRLDGKTFSSQSQMQSTPLVLCILFELDYILKKQTEQHSEACKELATLDTFTAMSESIAPQEKRLKIKQVNIST